MTLSDDDLREIFGLFTSPSRYERDQIYKPGIHFFESVDLKEEYELTEEKVELARDAWRAVIAFLHRHGYELKKGSQIIPLSFIEKEFVG
jgi:hypothetical protein